MKTCRTCKVEQPLRQFYRAGNGHRGECKGCKCVYAQDMYQLKREQVLAQRRQYNATPAARATRIAYWRSPRGRRMRIEAQRFYRASKRMEASA